jgi:phenylpropionate dioxygenase-like ring-hydroxylating dioxygenase large terminal subunit
MAGKAQFLRNAWYVAASANEVGRIPLPRLLLGEPIVFYRRGDGTSVALEDRCCHRRAPLSKGKIVDDRLQCGYHGFTFDASGACVAIPGQDSVPTRIGVRSYRLVEWHGFIWIWMGEAAKADPARIPDFKENTSPGWWPTRVMLPIKGHYQLVVENLLDLSHVAFVHGETIGSDDTRATLEFGRGDNYVRLVPQGTRHRDAAFLPLQRSRTALRSGKDHNLHPAVLRLYPRHHDRACCRKGRRRRAQRQYPHPPCLRTRDREQHALLHSKRPRFRGGAGRRGKIAPDADEGFR